MVSAQEWQQKKDDKLLTDVEPRVVPDLVSKKFPKTLRLRANTEFQLHFKTATKKIVNSHFIALIKSNNLGRPRIGISLTKKKIASAAERNRIKRIVRESFRHKQDQLPPVDIVIVAKHKIQDTPSELLRTKLEQQWQEIIAFYRKA